MDIVHVGSPKSTGALLLMVHGLLGCPSCRYVRMGITATYGFQDGWLDQLPDFIFRLSHDGNS